MLSAALRRWGPALATWSAPAASGRAAAAAAACPPSTRLLRPIEAPGAAVCSPVIGGEYLQTRRGFSAFPDAQSALDASDAAEAADVAERPSKFAVVWVGGKQYKVTNGDLIMTEKLLGAEVGQQIRLLKVLLVGALDYTAVGQPVLESASVLATVEEQTRAEKAIIFKKKRRKGYRRHKGHKQHVTTLRIDDVVFDE